MPDEVGGIGEARRRALLDRMVERYVENGYTVETNTGWQAVVTKPQAFNVPLNLAMLIITGGFWLIVLLLRIGNRPKDRVVLRINEHGDLTAGFTS